MTKQQSVYICQQCGYQSPSYLGKCPECGEWNSLVETLLRQGSGGQAAAKSTQPVDLIKLSEVTLKSVERISTGYSEFDRVLGGGIVPGSIVLIAGDPGIGKSTLLLQTAMKIAENGKLRKLGTSEKLESQKTRKSDKSDSLKIRQTESSEYSVLYITGEESAQQVKIRADRISKIPPNLLILANNDVDVVVGVAEELKPKFVIVDSIQTLTRDDLAGGAGSVGQVRECAQVLQRFAKSSQIPVFLVGHVTKEGNVAGPKVLEHLVDAVMNLEGDGMHNFRLLRSIKNRFGSTFEVGVFEMGDSGMVEVTNPSGIFLAQRDATLAGSVVCSTIAGGRPILAEIQALCSSTVFPVPTRRVSGLDFARMQVVIAAISRAAKISTANLDIFVNVAGGLKINEPAADLAVALAIASSVQNKAVKKSICAFGEVGLLGELRPVGNPKNRMQEARRLGFSDFVTADRFKTLSEAIKYAIG